MSRRFGWQTGELVRATRLAEAARSLIFSVPGWPGNQAGQHVDIRLTAPDGYQAVRSYSLASSGPGDLVELAVERLPGGEVSPFLVDDLEVGNQVEMRGPLGGWFVWWPHLTRPVQLIAGGSGVVPLLAMLRSHADSASTATMQLLYSLRSPFTALYRDELDGSGVDTTWHYSRVTPPEWPHSPGRLTVGDLAITTLPAEHDPLIYVCGRTGFVEHITRALTGLGHNPDSIRTERFGGI